MTYISAPVCETRTGYMWGHAQSRRYFEDQEVVVTNNPWGGYTDMDWVIVSQGSCKMCENIQYCYYPKDGIYATESRCIVKDNNVEVARRDTFHVEYFQGYRAQLHTV